MAYGTNRRSLLENPRAINRAFWTLEPQSDARPPEKAFEAVKSIVQHRKTVLPGRPVTLESAPQSVRLPQKGKHEPPASKARKKRTRTAEGPHYARMETPNKGWRAATTTGDKSKNPTGVSKTLQGGEYAARGPSAPNPMPDTHEEALEAVDSTVQHRKTALQG